MFSDQEIRAAMDGLVKQKGENHTSFGKYADPMTGKGACFLGALAEYMGRAIPDEATAAKNALGKGAVSPSMSSAFVVAQMLNDMRFEWKYVLMAVDEALQIGPLGNESTCPCGCMGGAQYAAVVEKVKAKRALDRAGMPKVLPGHYKAMGGIVSPSLSTSLGSITYTIDGMSESIYSLSAAMNSFTASYSYVGAKKDHALVA